MSKKETLTINEKYTYNEVEQKYVFHTEEKLGKNYVLDKSKVDTILKLYSNFDKNQRTTGEIAQITSTPKKVIEYVIRSLGVVHDSIPYSPEVLAANEVDSLVRDMLLEKRANVEQKFERLDWKKVQEDAESWRVFQYNYGRAFDSLIQSWVPKPYVPSKTRIPATKKSKDELVIGCSDWHYGLIANGRYLYNQKEWNIEETEKAVERYADKLVTHITSQPIPYKKITLAFLGDLLHGLDGFTDKGTKLEAHPLREEQLERAFNSVLRFIQRILEVSSNVRVFAVPGNHSSFGDYILLKMLEIYFQNVKNIAFEITSKRFITFDVGPNLFLMEHGYSAVAKSRLPAHGSGRENYLNNLFMFKPEKTAGKKRFYYLSGDQHHTECQELTNVETYMFSTLVGGCRHSDNSNYKSRPRQSCLVVNDEGVTSFMHFYLD